MFKRLFLGAILGASLVSSVAAGVLREDKGDGDWEILFAPYLWGVAVDGNAGPGGKLPVDASFSDIASNLDMALSLHTEFHKGKWAFVIDPTFLSLQMDIKPQVPVPIEPKADVDAWLVEAWASYEFLANWEVLAGVRYQDQKIKVNFNPTGPGMFPESLKVKEKWSDFFAGFRAIYPLGDKWLFSGRADVVLFGDSDTSYNVEAFFNRRIGKTMALNLGYRYLRDDFDNNGQGTDSFVWDVKMQGPVVGYTWAF